MCFQFLEEKKSHFFPIYSLKLAKSGCSKWDICPGDAIMTGLGGSIIGIDGNKYTYEEPKDTYLCGKGVIGVLRTEILEKVLERTKNTWMNSSFCFKKRWVY